MNTTLSIFNFILALISAMPCLMVCVMSMDSPQAQNSLASHIICWLILSFPVVCLVCSILAPFVNGEFSIFIAMIPVCEMVFIIAALYLISFFMGE